MKKKKLRIIYDPSLEVEKKENFVSTKLGNEVSQVKNVLERLPSSIKWLLAVLISGFLSAVIGIITTFYFNVEFNSFEKINTILRVQFIIDAIIVAMIIIFIGLLIKEARSN